MIGWYSCVMNWLDDEPIHVLVTENDMGFKLEGHTEYMGILLGNFYAYALDSLGMMIMGGSHMEQVDD